MNGGLNIFFFPHYLWLMSGHIYYNNIIPSSTYEMCTDVRLSTLDVNPWTIVVLVKVFNNTCYRSLWIIFTGPTDDQGKLGDMHGTGPVPDCTGSILPNIPGTRLVQGGTGFIPSILFFSIFYFFNHQCIKTRYTGTNWYATSPN